jgi:GDP-L-fucose synthase
MDKILITGARGFLGRHLVPVLQSRYGFEAVVGIGREDGDLNDPSQVRRILGEHKPEAIIHLAAYVGGIGANTRYPADFFYRNAMLTTVMFQAAAEANVRKLVYPICGCGYPANASSPIGEEQIWAGYPQCEGAPYAQAKKMGLVAAESYRRQYGLITSVPLPGNMYGEHDNFRTGESHVVPAMVRRFVEAAQSGARQVTMWGSGRPTRDFVYAGDIAEVMPYFLEKHDSPEPVNLSSGISTSIRELAELVRELSGFSGEIVWDTTKPDGQMTKIFGVERMRQLGICCPTTLEQGLKRTIEWYRANCGKASDGIRL